MSTTQILVLSSFGQDGYVVLYRVDIPADTVTIVAMRHQREAGFEGQGTEAQ